MDNILLYRVNALSGYVPHNPTRAAAERKPRQ